MAEKIPQTLPSKEFMEFSYFENCKIFGRKCQVGDLFKGDTDFHSEWPGLFISDHVFIKSDPTFSL